MRMTVERFEKLESVLLKTITKEPIKWSNIVESVKSEKITVKNWMSVRGVLQSLLDNGKIKRTNSVYEESYYLA